MRLRDIYGIFALIIVFVVLGAVIFRAPDALAPKGYAPVEIHGESLSVDSVTADTASMTVTVTQPSFVTLNQKVGSAPGPVVGTSSLIQPGENQKMTLSSSVPFYSGSFTALLFVDDGDGVYEQGVDLPVVSDGKSMRFDIDTQTPNTATP